MSEIFDPYADFYRHELPNGLKIYAKHMNRPWVRVAVIVHSGSREDPLDRPGLAHFVEHLVGENVKGHTPTSIESFFEDIGGAVTLGQINYHRSIYTFKIPADRATLEQALDIFGTMLLESRITKKVDRERNVIIQEYYEVYPTQQKLRMQMGRQREIFRGHRLATWNHEIGQLKGIKSIDVQNLQQFYAQHYVPANMSIVVVGGLIKKYVMPAVHRSPFGNHKTGVNRSVPPAFTKFSLPKVRMNRLSVATRKAPQVNYTLSWGLPGNINDELLEIFGSILTDTMFREIRYKRGLAYDMGAASESFQDVHSYHVGCRISPQSMDKVGKIIHDCIEMTASKRKLFEKNRKMHIQQCNMHDLSGHDIMMAAAQDIGLYHRIITSKEIIENLESITFEDMSTIAELLSSKRQYTLVAI